MVYHPLQHQPSISTIHNTTFTTSSHPSLTQTTILPISFNLNLHTLYTQVIIDHYKNPTNKPLLNHTILLHINNPTSPHPIPLTIKIQHQKLIHAKFQPQ
ncbi:iron-sulfur cluster assembly scaffold protein, partial [Bacillus altitudinis]|uniref:iron-sulfur cluster assembly scaffold protein n=1 Tax=Bacillus altitudinis TaxID=293387 RepID=UPI002353DF0E